MRKLFSILMVVISVLAVMPVSVDARGYHRNSEKYSLCGFENCNTAGTHIHDGTYYCGHYIGDGHEYHQLCGVQDCTISYNHEHDGITCFPHTYGDGHNYHSAIRRAGCCYH